MHFITASSCLLALPSCHPAHLHAPPLLVLLLGVDAADVVFVMAAAAAVRLFCGDAFGVEEVGCADRCRVLLFAPAAAGCFVVLRSGLHSLMRKLVSWAAFIPVS